MGALSFPTPFFIFFYLLDIQPSPDDQPHRLLMVLLLLCSGGLVGVGGYYKDSSINAMKDWFPSDSRR